MWSCYFRQGHQVGSDRIDDDALVVQRLLIRRLVFEKKSVKAVRCKIFLGLIIIRSLKNAKVLSRHDSREFTLEFCNTVSSNISRSHTG